MRKVIGVLAVGLTFAQMGLGAGFERSVMWSGKYAGVADSGSATSRDSESLYFNPAGLSDVKGIEVSGNLSPTWIQAKAPVTTNNVQMTGDSLLVPAVGLTAAYKLSDALGIGAGAFVSGGSRAKYSNVNIGLAFNPDYISEVSLVEYSLGAAYKVLPGFKLGAAWRILRATGKLYLPKAALGGAIHFDNLATTNYNGFRLGGQYDGKNWGLGLTFRSGVDFTLSGDLSLQTGANTSTPNGTGTASNSFPIGAVFGGYYDVDKNLRLIAEYAYANYARNKQLNFTGTLLGGAVNLANTPIAQNWKDLHMGRLAAEYRGLEEYTLRAGYALVGEVTPKEYALPTFSSPGMGHSFTVGAGHSYLKKSLDLDFSFEYSFASGTVTTSDIPAGNTSTKAGDYSSHALAGHMGATYRF